MYSDKYFIESELQIIILIIFPIMHYLRVL